MEDYTNEPKKKSGKKVLKMIVNKIIHPNIISLIVVAVIVGGLFFFIGKVSNSKAEPEHKEVVTQLSLKDIGTLSTQEAYVTVVEAMDENRKLYDAEDAPDVPLTNSVCVFSHDFQITAGYDFEKIIAFSYQHHNKILRTDNLIEQLQQTLFHYSNLKFW